MALEASDVIDLLVVEKSGRIVLGLIDGSDWTDEHAHLLALQDKLNAYSAFVEEGEVFERVASLRGETVAVARERPVAVRITARCQLPPIGEEFLGRARAFFAEVNIDVEFRVRLDGTGEGNES